jgi:spermidine synthase
MTDRLYVLAVDGMEQSAVDLDDPTHLVFDYMRRIGDLIDALEPPAPSPIRVLHVGGAAMTLARYVAATRPHSGQTVLEPNEEVIALVRVQAPIPRRSGIKVRAVDGYTGIQQLRDNVHDLVILDAFAAGTVPAELTSADFVEQVRRILAPNGAFVANLVDRSPFPLIRSMVARTFGTVVVGAEPATLKGRRSGNVLVACGELPPHPFGSPSPMAYRVFTGRAVADTFGGG